MTEFSILDGKLWFDDVFSPGYVWFRCADYGLEDNTRGKAGYHVMYRPLCDDGISDEMRADVKALYQAERDAAAAAEADRRARMSAAHKVVMSIPRAAKDELAAVQRAEAAHFAGMNEGGEGYAHVSGWRSAEGRAILKRHGVDFDAPAIAEAELDRLVGR